ncbi:MAG: PAS domain S-box protein [Proteobacteria bacterium]|nr:PAS domain S-box protein [Pseudomonadota bacterium]MBU1965862.1 PAS domain S-box protein [Pseudomonadota bacterium]
MHDRRNITPPQGDALRRAEENFRRSLDESPLGVRIVTMDGETLYANQALLDIYGYDSVDELEKTPVKVRYTPESFAEYQVRREKRVRGEYVPTEYEVSIVRKVGEVRYLEVFRREVLWDGKPQLQTIYHDITDRRRLEQELRLSEERYRRITEGLTDYVYTCLVRDGRVVQTIHGTACEAVTGYRVEEFAADAYLWINMIEPEDRDHVKEAINIILSGRHPEPIEHRIVRKDGQVRWVSDTPVLNLDAGGRLVSYDGVIKDITGRKRAEEALQRAHAELEQRVADRTAELTRANEELRTEIAERKRAEKELRESEGRFRALVEQAAVGVAEIETSTGRVFTVNRCLCKMVGRTEEEVLASTFYMFTHPEDLHLHKEKTALLLAGKIGHYSLEKRYHKKNGETVWVNITVSPLWKPGETPERNMVVVENITERKRAEEQLQQTIENLRKAVNTTIQVMVSTVEARDPYTSGHQLRSADLARAIATEMGLPQDKIDAIRMAGSIHDIGKISIPAEILSKPTQLSEIEFALIKAHAQRGFEMLKDVESPWPLAEIVYQHHERMDGSGYPRNLKGDDILMEARILTVADVVEAMASHRPYRAALGIEAALTEIEKNKGILYDADAADVCLRLFREKGYELPQ